MVLDPRTPVLVGAGQVNERDGGVEPVDLIAAAARDAAAQAEAPRLLECVDSVRLVKMLSWKYRDPGRLVGQRIGASPRHTGYTGNGGNAPQALVNGAAVDIRDGRCSAVLIGGAEAWRTRTKLRAEGTRPEWTVQEETLPAAESLIPEVPMRATADERIGLDRPAYVYPLFEQALRISARRSPGEHRQALGRLWAGFSRIASANPYAWDRREYSPAEIITPTQGNRQVSDPYTKLLNSNNMVEQAAALLMCSAEKAEALGVPRENWVFPQAGAESHDTYAIAERPALDASPAIRAAGQKVLSLSGVGIREIAHADVYSCFPSAVQVAAQELGLPLDCPEQLTVTGGLTFAGGPWNNYSTHAIAGMMSRLRESPGDYGLVTANGGYLTKHALGVYRTEPPPHGFRWADVQREVDSYSATPVAERHSGPARLESWTVIYDRSGRPERGFAAARTQDGERTLAATEDEPTLHGMVTTDVAGRMAHVDREGSFRFPDG